MSPDLSYPPPAPLPAEDPGRQMATVLVRILRRKQQPRIVYERTEKGFFQGIGSRDQGPASLMSPG